MRFDRMYERDGQTDGQTHRHRIMAKAALDAAKTLYQSAVVVA